MDYKKRHFECFSCRICALTIIELLHLTFTRKTSSFSARLSLHTAKLKTVFHSNHMHTTCSHMRSHGNAQECDKNAGFTVM